MKWFIVDTVATFCLTVNPMNPDVVWAGHENGTISRRNLSTNEAPALFRVNKSGVAGHPTCIAIDPRDTMRMYLGGVLMAGVYRSTDAGRTWSLWFSRPHRLMFLTGSALHIVYDGDLRRIMVGDFSSGQLHITEDDGHSWNSSAKDTSGRICSILPLPSRDLAVMAGCRDGRIVEFVGDDLQPVTRFKSSVNYSEIPKMYAATDDNLFAITVGFDSLNQNYGVLHSSDGGTTWRGRWFQGVSLWGLAVCPCGRHFAIGGFSEFKHIVGSGYIAIVDHECQSIQELGESIPWYRSRIASVWDIVTSIGVQNRRILYATENGIYALCSDG